MLSICCVPMQCVKRGPPPPLPPPDKYKILLDPNDYYQSDDPHTDVPPPEEHDTESSVHVVSVCLLLKLVLKKLNYYYSIICRSSHMCQIIRYNNMSIRGEDHIFRQTIRICNGIRTVSHHISQLNTFLSTMNTVFLFLMHRCHTNPIRLYFLRRRHCRLHHHTI